jgi:hypothetical protein
MKQIIFLFCIIFCATNLNAQNILLDETVDVSVCFTANHTYVSDLGFYLVAPGQTSTNPGNYGILQLLPAASDWGEEAAFNSWTEIPWDVLGCNDPEDMNTVCNSGNNLENFCFTSTLEAGNPDFTACICDTETPLTGDFASVETWEYVYGFPLIGNWGLSIFDCESIDYGELVEGSITFETADGRTVTYSLIPENPIPINDGSCSIETASLLIYSPDLFCSLDITINNEVSTEAIAFTSNVYFEDDIVPFEPFYSFDSIEITEIIQINDSDYEVFYKIHQDLPSKSGVFSAVYSLGSISPELINLKLNISWLNSTNGASQTINVNHEINNDSPEFSNISNNSLNNINIFPNPANNIVTIETNNEQDFILSIYSVEGKLIKQNMINSTSYIVSIKDLAAGNYEFVISNNKGNVSKSFSILKE